MFEVRFACKRPKLVSPSNEGGVGGAGVGIVVIVGRGGVVGGIDTVARVVLTNKNQEHNQIMN